MALTASQNGKPYLAQMSVPAVQDDFAAGDVSIGLGPRCGAGVTAAPQGDCTAIRRCIVALLQDRPEGLTPAEMRAQSVGMNTVGASGSSSPCLATSATPRDLIASHSGAGAK